MTDMITIPRVELQQVLYALGTCTYEVKGACEQVFNDDAIDAAITALTERLVAASKQDAYWSKRADDLLSIEYPADVPEVSGAFRAKTTPQPAVQPLITAETSLRFMLDTERQKSADLLDEIRELKGVVAKLKAPQPVQTAHTELSAALDRAIAIYGEANVAKMLAAQPALPRNPIPYRPLTQSYLPHSQRKG